MSLRDEITKLLSKHPYAASLGYADAILALPSGLVAVKDCVHYGTNTSYAACPVCGDTGRIERDMTVQEAIEELKRINEAINIGNGGIYLKSGERVEVKK